MLELRAVRHRYEEGGGGSGGRGGGRVVLDLEVFAVPPGALIGIVGHNGSGKSTLLRLLALLERPSEGEVRFDGKPVTPRNARALRRRVTLVEQRPVLFRGTVRENLGYGLRVRGIKRAEVNRILETAAERLGVQGLLSRERHELSDGEVQRVAVARAWARSRSPSQPTGRVRPSLRCRPPTSSSAASRSPRRPATFSRGTSRGSPMHAPARFTSRRTWGSSWWRW